MPFERACYLALERVWVTSLFYPTKQSGERGVPSFSGDPHPCLGYLQPMSSPNNFPTRLHTSVSELMLTHVTAHLTKHVRLSPWDKLPSMAAAKSLKKRGSSCCVYGRPSSSHLVTRAYNLLEGRYLEMIADGCGSSTVAE